jgi:hypothetical protein
MAVSSRPSTRLDAALGGEVEHILHFFGVGLMAEEDDFKAALPRVQRG